LRLLSQPSNRGLAYRPPPTERRVPGALSARSGLDEFRRRTREQESRLLPAIEEAASRAGPGIHPLVPPRPLSDREVRERWVQVARGFEQGLTLADVRHPAEGIYASERSAEETYRRYVAAYEPGEIRYDHGCGPQAALDPEGAIVCSFMLQPAGGTDGLSFTVGPEYVTSEDRPARDYPQGPGNLPTRLVTVVRIEGGAPTSEVLRRMAIDDGFLERVEVRPLRAGLGSPGWEPGLPSSVVWAELEVTAPEDTTARSPLEIEGSIACGGSERNLSDVLNVPGGKYGRFVAGKPGTVRLLNDDDPVEACPLGPGRHDLRVMLRRGESVRFITLPVELAPTPPE
jgi:hypothetical protein